MLHPLQLKEVSQRYTAEIAELRDYLGKASIPVETPGAIASVAARLQRDAAFRRDLALHLWAISNAPGQHVGYPDAMAMLAIAAAGTLASDAAESDTHELLRFVMEARTSFAPGSSNATPGTGLRTPAFATAAPAVGDSLHSATSSANSHLDPEDDNLPVFATEDSRRRAILWSAVAVCALLFLCFGLWLHRRPSAATTAIATAPLAPAKPVATQASIAPSAPPQAAPKAPHRTRSASAAVAFSAAPHNRTFTPPPTPAPRSKALPSAALPVSVASTVPSTKTPARPAPEAPASAPRTLARAAAPSDIAPQPSTKASRSNSPVYRSSSDTPLVVLKTPVVRPTTLGNMASHLTYGPAPQYPAAAVDQQVQGEVRLEAEVDRTGNVISARVVSGPPQLQEAAMNAVQSWQYRPYLYDGKPIAVNATVVMDFQLQ